MNEIVKSIFRFDEAQQRYFAEWQSKPLQEEDWQNNIIHEQNGVKLIEVAVGVYVVEYCEQIGPQRFQRRSLYLDWSTAEADFCQRVEEGDYR